MSIDKPKQLVSLEDAVICQEGKEILKKVNLSVNAGEIIYLVGPIGSGKTSLLKTIYGDLPLTKGKGSVFEYNLRRISQKQTAMLRRRCGMVFQDFQLLMDRNIYANLDFVLKVTGWNHLKDRDNRIKEVLELVGMDHSAAKFPYQISGGEQQLVVLARALLNKPPLILADEPTNSIDSESAERLLRLFRELNEKGQTLIIATHRQTWLKHLPGRLFQIENQYLLEKMIPSATPIESAPQESAPQESAPQETAVAPPFPEII